MDWLLRERKTVITTFILAGVLLVGLGVFAYSSHRMNQEIAVNDELRLEAITLRSTLTRLEKSLAALKDLPPVADADWEKNLVDQINGVVGRAGVQLRQLTFSLQSEDKSHFLGVVSFRLEVEGKEAGQARCLALLQESVVGMKLEAVDGLLGGTEAYLLNRADGSSLSSERMSITGQVFFEVGAHTGG